MRKTGLLSYHLSLITYHRLKNLPRIEYAVRVEGAFDAAHGFDGGAVEGHFEVRRFDVADAVLAADRAAEFDRGGESLADGRARAADGPGVFAVAHEVDVDVAVAEV